jgi:hypothetical protein
MVPAWRMTVGAGCSESSRAVQAQLVPHDTRFGFGTPSAVTPTALQGNREQGHFWPGDGRGGDLLTLMDDQQRCTLWFCVQGEENGNAAQWARVLMGPSFAGAG